MIYIGIDPGLAATGLAAIETDKHRHLCLFTATIRTQPGASVTERINIVLGAIEGQLTHYNLWGEPIAVETPITQFTPGARNLAGIIGCATVAGACFGRFKNTRLVTPMDWLRGKSLVHRHEEFRLATGYKEKCSNHARDAACIALAVALGRV